MYVIRGMQREAFVGRKMIRSTCRAEWNRYHNLVSQRSSAITVEHVRSHKRDSDTGELVGWVDMTQPQRGDAVADALADLGILVQSLHNVISQ